MRINDKNKIISKISELDCVVIELGCGKRNRIKDSIGIDRIDYKNVSIVGDVVEVLKEIPDKSVDALHSHHFLSHLENIEIVFFEMDRVLKKGGSIHIVTPHFSNAYFYSDYTHKTPFGLYTLSYFIEDDYFSRKVPKYTNNYLYKYDQVNLIFKSPRPFYLRYAFRKAIQLLVNINTYTKEFYEENMSGIISCYEIEFVITKD
jgi:ubiquinone/menaquinone biosynthesis C-methylase UbiE